jgi:hypothetical protein
MSLPYLVASGNTLTVILTNKSKNELLKGNSNFLKITKFSISDNDVNYNTGLRNEGINRVRGEMGDCLQSINLEDIKNKIKWVS